MLTTKERSLLNALEPRALDSGIEIVTIEVVGSRKAPTICVYIDAPGGVSFDALASAQSWINEMMDELDPFPGAYTLEVSSPGIDRPLRTSAHFQKAQGETVVITLCSPVDGRGKWTGVLKRADDETVTLDVDGRDVVLELENIKRAHVKGTIDFKA